MKTVRLRWGGAAGPLTPPQVATAHDQEVADQSGGSRFGLFPITL